MGEAFAHSDVFASRLRVFEVLPSTGDEHHSNHDAQKKKRNVSELG
jgi:hypothetical protein